MKTLSITGPITGHGGSDSPTIERNTLQCKTIGRGIDVLCEGEIAGLVDGMRSVFFNDVPLIGQDGEINFSGVTVSSKNGTTGQTHIPQFAAIESLTSVGVEILQENGGVVRAITDTTVDDVKVIVSIPSLLKTKDDGSRVKTQVSYSIFIQAQGQSWAVADVVTVTGKCQSTFLIPSKIIGLKDRFGEGPWNIKIVRNTPDSDIESLSNKTYFSSFVTIINEKITYPDTAYAAFEIDAQLFGMNIPTRNYLIKGKLIKVPNGYDPETRTYPAIWDGTFSATLQYSNNPAWALYDVLTSTRYGLGINPAYIDKWAFYTAARYCDDMVPDGFGGTEPRYTFNAYIQTADDSQSVIAAMASSFHSKLLWTGSLLTIVMDRPRNVKKLVSPANVIDGLFNYSGTGLKNRKTVVAVAWNDPSQRYKKAYEVVEDKDAINRYGYNELTVVGLGITSRGQARRYAKWLLFTELYQTETIAYKAGMDHLDVLPGQIVEVRDPNNDTAIYDGGRLVWSSTTTMKLDRPVAFTDTDLIEENNYTFSVILKSGDLFVSKILHVNEDPTEIIVEDLPPVDDAPLPSAMWGISYATKRTKKYQVVSKKEADKNVFEITALIYLPEKYAVIDGDSEFRFNNDYGVIKKPDGALTGPTNLTVKKFVINTEGQLKTGALISFTHSTDARVTYYEVECFKDGDLPEFLKSTASNTIEISDRSPEEYQFKVRAVGVSLSSGKIYSQWVVSNIDATPIEDIDGSGVTDVCQNVVGLEIKGQGNDTIWREKDLHLSWSITQPVDYTVESDSESLVDMIKHYIVKIYDTDSGALLKEDVAMANSYVFTYATNSLIESGPFANLTVKVTAISKTGIESKKPAILSVNNLAPAPVSGLRSERFTLGARFAWDKNNEIDFDHYKYTHRVRGKILSNAPGGVIVINPTDVYPATFLHGITFEEPEYYYYFNFFIDELTNDLYFVIKDRIFKQVAFTGDFELYATITNEDYPDIKCAAICDGNLYVALYKYGWADPATMQILKYDLSTGAESYIPPFEGTMSDNYTSRGYLSSMAVAGNYIYFGVDDMSNSQVSVWKREIDDASNEGYTGAYSLNFVLPDGYDICYHTANDLAVSNNILAVTISYYFHSFDYYGGPDDIDCSRAAIIIDGAETILSDGARPGDIYFNPDIDKIDSSIYFGFAEYPYDIFSVVRHKDDVKTTIIPSLEATYFRRDNINNFFYLWNIEQIENNFYTYGAPAEIELPGGEIVQEEVDVIPEWPAISTWNNGPETSATIILTAEQLKLSDILIDFKVCATDTFGLSSATTELSETIDKLIVDATDVDDFIVDASKTFTEIPILDGEVWTNDQTNMRVCWNAHDLYFEGVKYDIAAGCSILDGFESPYPVEIRQYEQEGGVNKSMVEDPGTGMLYLGVANILYAQQEYSGAFVQERVFETKTILDLGVYENFLYLVADDSETGDYELLKYGITSKTYDVIFSKPSSEPFNSVAVDQSNGTVYVMMAAINGVVYKQTNGAGSFVSHATVPGAGKKIRLSQTDLYVGTYQAIYKQTGKAGTFSVFINNLEIEDIQINQATNVIYFIDNDTNKLFYKSPDPEEAVREITSPFDIKTISISNRTNRIYAAEETTEPYFQVSTIPGPEPVSIPESFYGKEYIFWTVPDKFYRVSSIHPGDIGLINSETGFIIAVNINGICKPAWRTVTNEVIGSAYIMRAAINDLHVESLSANKIKAGTVMTPGVQIGGITTLPGLEDPTDGQLSGWYLNYEKLGFYEDGWISYMDRLGNLALGKRGTDKSMRWDTTSGRFVVGNQNIIIDAEDNSIVIAEDGGPETGDYAILKNGSIEMYRYVGGAHIKRSFLPIIRTGLAYNNTIVNFGYFPTEPHISLTIESLKIYSNTFVGTDQYLKMEVGTLTKNANSEYSGRIQCRITTAPSIMVSSYDTLENKLVNGDHFFLKENLKHNIGVMSGANAISGISPDNSYTFKSKTFDVALSKMSLKMQLLNVFLEFRWFDGATHLYFAYFPLTISIKYILRNISDLSITDQIVTHSFDADVETLANGTILPSLNSYFWGGNIGNKNILLKNQDVQKYPHQTRVLGVFHTIPFNGLMERVFAISSDISYTPPEGQEIVGYEVSKRHYAEMERARLRHSGYKIQGYDLKGKFIHFGVCIESLTGTTSTIDSPVEDLDNVVRWTAIEKG